METKARETARRGSTRRGVAPGAARWQPRDARRSPPSGGRPRLAVVGALAAAAAVAAAGPGITPASAQSAQERDGVVGRCGAPWTALGIGRVSCTACSLSFGRGVEPDARFGAEPLIFPMEPSVARGDRIRAGDRLVSVDGELITTGAGASALVGVRRGDEVTLTVRRDGETRELGIVAGDACDVEPPPLPHPAPAEPPGEPMPEPLPPAGAPSAPLAPSPSSAPLPAPAAPSELPPAARLGFAFSCSDCGIREGRWFFSAPPEVTGVERDGPAWEAGVRTGDELVGIGGHAIVSEAGERAFSAIRPGDRVRWDVRRNGEVRQLTLTAAEKPARPARAPEPPRPGRRSVGGAPGGLDLSGRSPAAPGGALRYHGRIGEVDVEVRGAPVTVTMAEGTGEIVIRTSDGTIIRLTREGGGGP